VFRTLAQSFGCFCRRLKVSFAFVFSPALDLYYCCRVQRQSAAAPHQDASIAFDTPRADDEIANSPPPVDCVQHLSELAYEQLSMFG
jgi:hypothetical protein